MGRAEKQKLKLIYLREILEENTDEEHGITMPEILQLLSEQGIAAERKSIYDDIELLQEWGMDIVKEKKNRKWYYKLVSRPFETGELKVLVDAVQASRFLSGKKSKELIGKLGVLTSKYQRKELKRQVYVVNRVKSGNDHILENIDCIHYAIGNNKRITFKYYTWNRKKEISYRRNGGMYEISPWFLCWSQENYYLIAYDSEAQQMKHYRVDKMRQLRWIETPRDGEAAFEGFSLPQYTKEHFGMFGGEQTKVRLRVPERLMGVMIDRFGEDVNIRPDPDCKDYGIIHAEVVVSDQFLGWLIGLGNEVEVLTPLHVRQQLWEKGKKLLQKYQS